MTQPCTASTIRALRTAAMLGPLRVALVLAGPLLAAGVGAQPVAAPAASAAASAARATAKVIVSGQVPDEATHQAILAKARDVYGDRVVDQIGVGNLVAPPNWTQYVQKIINGDLKQVSKGQLKITGNTIELTGEVQNEAQSQQIASQMSANLNPTYTIRNGLRIVAPAAAPAPAQEVLDAALANRIVEFQAGNSVLTPVGIVTLDSLVPVLARFKGRRFEVIGHTDAQGSPAGNRQLSADRANAVKSYLAAKGIDPTSVVTSGAGADRPIARNDTAEGRSRNRRIEFRVLP